MRITLWLLLALNLLAAAAWMAGFSLPPKQAAELTVPTPSAKPLQLLSELPALPPRIDTLAADSEAAGPPGEKAPVEMPSAVGESPASGAPAGAQAPAPSATGAELPIPKPPAPVISLPAPRVEATATPEPAATVASPPPADAPPASAAADAPLPAGPACYRTAALAANAYEEAGAALREAGFSELKLQPQSRARQRYWVYWSGAPDAVTDIEERLKAAAVRDWYRLRGADGGARISLGVYGRADGARRRQRELAAQGIQAQVGESFPPQAKLRWTFTAQAAAVDAVKASLEGRGVRLEACP